MSLELSKVLTAYSSATEKVKKTVEQIIDANSFVELDALIGGKNELGEFKGEGVLCGLASIDDIDVAVLALNPEVFGGGLSKRGAEKIERLVNRAVDSGLPLVSLINTSGARIFEGVDALSGYGTVLNCYAQAYGCVPIFTIVTEKNYGMLSYLSGLSDMFIAVDKAQVATASPLLVTATAGDGKSYSDAASLAASSGSITNVVKNTAELKKLLTDALYLYCDYEGAEDDANRQAKIKAGASADSIIKEVFDKSIAIEFRSEYAKEVKTVLAKLDGLTVGVVAITGKLTAEGGNKITDFINSVTSFDIPIINLVDSIGVVVDYKQESGNLMRSISDVVYAYSNAEVAKIALITGEAVGAGYSIFAAKNVYDFTFAFENAHISPIESAAAARLLYGDEIAKAKNSANAEKKFADTYSDENSAFVAAEKGYLDNLIMPAHARQYLISAVRTLLKR